jgi:hypothetical protein
MAKGARMTTARQLERLTGREFDILLRAIVAEAQRRREHAEQRRHERARMQRMWGDVVNADERRAAAAAVQPSTPHNPLPPGAGGFVMSIDRDRGLRIVRCGACSNPFEYPLQRGRAPRACPTCKDTR